MKAFHCDQCGSLVFFENTQCLKCQATLGYSPERADLLALESAGEGLWRAWPGGAKDQTFRACRNQVEYQVCNWLVPASESAELCQACRLNQTIPDLSVPGNRERWHKLEMAKRRLLYILARLGLLADRFLNQERAPLRFQFLGGNPGGPKPLTGHCHGLITINIEEADDVVREQARVTLHEPYRTLVGHFRHESAHFYWDQLIANSSYLPSFHELFGDERQDYAGALEAYYKSGPPADWSLRHVSAYASAHPWEDWAETWAHYLHIQETLETSASFGLSLKPRHPNAAAITAEPQVLDEDEKSFTRILRHWLPLTYSLNELNRGMGLPDAYPFVLSDISINKLRFIHDLVRETRTQQHTAEPGSEEVPSSIPPSSSR